MRLLLLVLFCLVALPAYAQVEARAVALQNGCKPTKIEMIAQTIGTVAEKTWLVVCENKVVGDSSGEPKTMKIRCRGRQCFVLN